VPSATLVGTSVLRGYSLKFHKRVKKDGSGKCNIVAGGSIVHVAIFAILESDRAKLDKCEGLGYGYDHKKIQIDEYGECSTYIAAANSIDDTLCPIDWYKEYVLRGARFHRFPDEYILALETQLTVTDADHERAQGEWKLIEKLCNGT
jgi:hypothetical protein